jgi:hypothetical protein
VKLFVDLDIRRFVVSPGVRSEPRGLEFKRGDAASVEIVFCRGAEEVQLESVAEIIWEVKKEGDYSGDPIIRAENMSYVSGYYTGAPVFDATAIDAEFTSDQEFFAAMMEVTWREPSASGYTSTNTAPLNVHNDVIKEGEELPALLLGGVPGTSAEAELVFAATSGVPDSGTLDLDGDEIHFRSTSAGGSAPSGALITYSAGGSVGDFLPALADVINTGITSVSGFTVTGSPSAHANISATTSLDSSLNITLKFTAKVAGVAGNSRTYDFDASDNSLDRSGTLSGGVDPRNVLIGDLVTTFEPETSLTSGEKSQARNNISAAPDNVIEASLAPQTLTDAATIVYDISQGKNAEVTLTANRTLSFPSNLFAGASGALVVAQDSTGGRSLTLASGWFVSAGDVADFTSLAANEKIQITWYCVDLYNVNATVLLLQ